MKKIYLLLSLLTVLLSAVKSVAQPTLVCNDLVSISLDAGCTHTILPEEILESAQVGSYVVTIDKVLPYGNGPWVPAVVGIDDLNKTYQVRVQDLVTGNLCWGNVTIEDKTAPGLQCNGLGTVSLDAGGTASVSAADLVVVVAEDCTLPADVTINFANDQSAMTFDCSNLGINIVTIDVTDGSGNTNSCQTTLLITDSGTCLNCVANCPPPVTVSFEEGFNTLRPAFLGGNWSAFDPYGDALFDQACTYQDSVYTVEYHPGIAGQSWFSRHWTWNDAGGQAVGACEQAIVFASSYTATVQGRVFLDNTANCVDDGNETGVGQFPLVVTKLPSGISQTFFPAGDGTYTLSIDFDVLDSAAVMHLQLPAGLSSVCPSALSIPYGAGVTTYNFDIGLQSAGNCPLMQVSMSALSARRCQVNTFHIQYCNIGLDTAQNVYATVLLDPLLIPQGSTLPYTVGPDNSLTFLVGEVPPFHCGSFNLGVMVSCDATLSQTLCSSATIFPDTLCSGAWAGPLVTTTARCEGDTVYLAVWNNGQQDMTEPLNFIVIEDFIMYKDGPFQLNTGDSITIKTSANGSTWRIEANQIADYPLARSVSAAIEGCGGLNMPGLINAFSQNDDAAFYDRECVQVTGSFDPNDKSAVPAGFDVSHFIRANEALEYKIRFQNTGNDTAFQVIVVDTLSALLDPGTLESGASSHPYRLDIYPGGILQFVFDPIALPDSNVNEAASHGFVQFRIGQQPDLPDGTVIENTAAIYFDQNDPVITNTVFHTIGQPYVLLESQTPYAPGVLVSLRPNPFRDQTVLEVQGKSIPKGVLSLFDAQGRFLRTLPLQDNRAVIERRDLQSGVYFFRVMENGIGVVGGRIVVE